MENGGAKMEQCNNKTNELEKTNRNSYQFRTNFRMPQYSHTFIHVKFVRNSYVFHVNFVQFANKESKHTSKHTLQILWACD